MKKIISSVLASLLLMTGSSFAATNQAQNVLISELHRCRAGGLSIDTDS